MDRIKLGSLIKEERIKRNISQEDLAGLIGCRRQAIIEVEKGRCNYGINILLSLIRELNLEITIMKPEYKFDFSKITLK